MGSERRIPARRVGLILVALATLAAGCSGGDSSDEGATTTTTAPISTVAASAGCGAAPVPVGETKVDLGPRWYLRHVPPAHDGTTPVPMVLDLHGYLEGASIHVAFSGLPAFGDQKGFVTITPQGSGPPATPYWDVGVRTSDTTFLRQVLDSAERDLCIDLDRVYVAGMSMGAFMTSALVCSDADRIAAAAPVAGIRDVPGCRPSRAVPVVAFHGTDDQIVAYDGGYGQGVASLPNGSGGTIGQQAVDATKNQPSIEEITATWAHRNRCDTGPASTEAVAADVTRLSWACPPGADVELYRIEGGGHSWPGSAFTAAIAPRLGPTTMSISANEVLWSFFLAHPRRVVSTCREPLAGTTHQTLDGRSYRQSIPNADGRRPLVIDLHGYAESIDSAAKITGFETLGRDEGFVTLTPQALGTPPAWDLAPNGVDVAFLTKLLDEAERTLCIDPHRVYVTGHSMGGFLISTLACTPLAARVAAWAPVAGLRDAPLCPPGHEPMLEQHATGDLTVFYDGGLSAAASTSLLLPEQGPSIPDLVHQWAIRNGCGDKAPLEHTDPSSSVHTWITYPCDVSLLRIEGGSHGWPPGAEKTIWRFFEQHST